MRLLAGTPASIRTSEARGMVRAVVRTPNRRIAKPPLTVSVVPTQARTHMAISIQPFTPLPKLHHQVFEVSIPDSLSSCTYEMSLKAGGGKRSNDTRPVPHRSISRVFNPVTATIRHTRSLG